MSEFVRSLVRGVRFRTRGGASRDESYKTWWDHSAATEAGAYATTYVADNEADYRSRGWNGDANSYGARHLIELAGLTKNSRVLEIGCGMARVGRELAPHVGEWHGADISRNMLEKARERTAHLSNVHLHELSDVSLAQFPTESFDFVYATTVFMHLDKEDLYQYLLESHRVLRPGGMAFFDTWNLLHPDTYRLWKGIQADNIGARKLRGRIQFTTPSELRRHLDEVGFEVVRFDEDRLLRAFCRKGRSGKFEPHDGLPPFGCVDLPRNEATVRVEMRVCGWVLDAVERVEIVVDAGQQLGSARVEDESPDVAPLFPRYAGAARCRWHIDVPLTQISSGQHTLRVIARDRNGATIDLAGNHLGFLVE